MRLIGIQVCCEAIRTTRKAWSHDPLEVSANQC
jgi:hypothetical protein